MSVQHSAFLVQISDFRFQFCCKELFNAFLMIIVIINPEFRTSQQSSHGYSLFGLGFALLSFNGLHANINSLLSSDFRIYHYRVKPKMFTWICQIQLRLCTHPLCWVPLLLQLLNMQLRFSFFPLSADGIANSWDFLNPYTSALSLED